MNNKPYRFLGYPLTKGIAKQLICELYAGKGPYPISEIREAVKQHHEEHGGSQARGKLSTLISRAITDLRGAGQANSETIGFWEIYIDSEVDNGEDIHYRKTIGSGNSSVYLYYFPIFRQQAKSRGEFVWKCKIGKTQGEPQERVDQQNNPRTGIPEEPVIALVIKTDNPDSLESAIHTILTARGKHVEEAPGTEWFLTNPDEVEEIYQFIDNE